MKEDSRSFENLEIWQEAIELALQVYTITKKFPGSEQFGITNQIRRSVASISANIAEGYGRHGKNDKLQFYAIAYGSLLETKSFIYLSHKLGYIDTFELEKLAEQITILQKKMNAFTKYVRSNEPPNDQ